VTCHTVPVTSDPLRPLLDAAAEGDDRAVAELVRRTQPAVWRLCLALGSDGEVEDLVQETYLQALRGAGRYRGDAPVQAWLLGIARHVCADHVRRRQRHRRLVDRVGRTASVEARRVEPVGGTADLVERLHPDRRDAFVLTQMVGLSYEEAAAVLGCPIGTIRSRVARARDDLLTALREAEAR
jgi:RNA polymerase sigma-70 factor (ECF subfamily)